MGERDGKIVQRRLVAAVKRKRVFEAWNRLLRAAGPDEYVADHSARLRRRLEMVGLAEIGMRRGEPALAGEEIACEQVRFVAIGLFLDERQSDSECLVLVAVPLEELPRCRRSTQPCSLTLKHFESQLFERRVYAQGVRLCDPRRLKRPVVTKSPDVKGRKRRVERRYEDGAPGDRRRHGSFPRPDRSGFPQRIVKCICEHKVTVDVWMQMLQHHLASNDVVRRGGCKCPVRLDLRLVSSTSRMKPIS